VQITGPELEDLAYQAAADAVMAITRKIGQFRGESRFTTWGPRANRAGSATRASPRTCKHAARAARTSTGCWPRCATRQLTAT